MHQQAGRLFHHVQLITTLCLEKINSLREERMKRLDATCSALEKQAGLGDLQRLLTEIRSDHISSSIEYERVRKEYFAVADKDLRKQLIAAHRERWAYLCNLKVRQVNEIRAVIFNMERKRYDGFFWPMCFTVGMVWVVEKLSDDNDVKGLVLFGVVATFLGVGYATKNVLERLQSIADLRESCSKTYQESGIVNSFAGAFSSREGETGEIDPDYVRRLKRDEEFRKGRREVDGGGTEPSERKYT